MAICRDPVNDQLFFNACGKALGILGQAREWSMEFAFKRSTTLAFNGAYLEIFATLKGRLI